MKLTYFLLLLSGVFLLGCSGPEVPPEENEEELITDVTLTFTPDAGGDALVFKAVDPDGEGPESLAPEAPIVLSASAAYTLDIAFANSISGEDITAEVKTEGAEHMIFFSFTNDIFSDPAGDGNADNRDDPVNYLDQDSNGFPLGLKTSWTTGGAADGVFRIYLKHQPGIKDATSTVNDGSTDVDVQWTLNIVN